MYGLNMNFESTATGIPQNIILGTNVHSHAYKIGLVQIPNGLFKYFWLVSHESLNNTLHEPI